MLDKFLTMLCVAALYFIAIYWCNKVTEVETDKLRKRIDELDEKINRLLLVLDDSSEQACEILDSLSPQREESES